MRAWLRIRLPLILIAVLTGAVGVVRADAVKLSGFWINRVTVQAVTEGQVIYHTATGVEVNQPLEELQGLRLTRFPQLQDAAEALDAGDAKQAAELFQQVARRARRTWVKWYALKGTVSALAQSGQAVQAARNYAALAGEADLHPFFLPAAPIEAVRQASESDRRRIAELLRHAMTQAKGEAQTSLEALLEAAAVAEPSTKASAAETTARPRNGAPGPGITRELFLGEPAVTLPDHLTGPIADRLRRGQFEQALEDAQAQLQVAGDLSTMLYLHGMAKLALADQRNDTDLYKDAGLSFMRVVVYFPRSGVLGPALLEAGYVHTKIGRPDLAQKLYERARLEIDPNNDSDYHERLTSLAGEEE